jgi:predicted metalloprotease with PDZ domain
MDAIRKAVSILAAATFFLSCGTSKKVATNTSNTLIASLDLVNVKDDQVKVEVTPTTINRSTITYQFPKVIPGTYAVANYGKYIGEFMALDKAGNALPVTKIDLNTWSISNATQLAKLVYWVNDTFDQEHRESTEDPANKVIFSPAGTNILAGENFWLNLCGFVGYFQDQVDNPYQLNILHPKELTGTSALTDIDPSDTRDQFQISRYAEVVDNPIMYARPDIARFTIQGMEVYLHVYSPRNKKVTAQYLLPELQKTMSAQKAFMGDIHQNKKYAVLAYLTSAGTDDAQGLGALEHNNSTSATFSDDMEADGLNHTISHEFFHTLTPLNVHSKEIHYFDFNNPKMSQHLWMYEGFTEYFSCLFKVNKGLIDEQSFYNLLMDKIVLSRSMYQDNLSMTEMSKRVLEPEMNKQFNNVYNKGTAVAMCLDIILREKSQGKRGILSLMGELSKIYGPERPFDDEALIPKITSITYPEVGEFLQRHVVGAEKIDYAAYLNRVGVATENVKEPVLIALTVDGKNYYRMDPQTNKAYIDAPNGGNEFVKSVGFQHNDEIIEMNGQRIEGSEAGKIVAIMGYKLKEGSPYTAKVMRNGKIIDLQGTVKLNQVDAQQLRFRDASKTYLKDQWLKH